jgi:hypothetical protein
MADVPLPCANVTKVAFGGADLLTAYVTTARAGLSKAALIDQPLAGGLFAFAAPVAGLPVNRVVLLDRCAENMNRHCEKRSDEAIQGVLKRLWIAALRSQ